jgi:hypothetical protein
MHLRTVTRITFALLLIDSAFWLVFAVITVAGLHPALPEGEVVRWLVPLLSVASSAGIVGFFLAARRKYRIFYYLLTALLLTITVLTLTDEFGWADFLVLIFHLLPLVLLLSYRNTFIKTSQRTEP